MGLSTTGHEELLGTTIKSSEYPGLPATNAFDASYSTFWAGANPGTEWVGKDCGVGIAATLVGVEISAEFTANELRVVGSLIQGAASTAFTSPTTYYTVPDPTAGGIPWLAGNRRNRIPISGASAQRCFRLQGNGTSVDGYASVAELRFIVAAGSGADARPVMPNISPWGGGYSSGSQTVTITSETTSAAIYYTVGTFASPPADPDNSSTLYTGPFSQSINSSGVVIKAVAYDTTCSTALSRVALPAYFRNYDFGMPDNSKPETLIYDITDGEKVEAASGSPYFHGSTHYLPTVSGLSGGATDQLGRYGMWMYTSTDGINWAKVGVNGNVLANPDWANVDNMLRNQIVYNASNSTWVMWSKIVGTLAEFWRHTTATDPASSSTTWASQGGYVPSGFTATADCSLFPCTLSQFLNGMGMVWTPESQADGLRVSSLSSDYLSFSSTWSIPDPVQGSGLATGEGCVAVQIGSVLAIIYCNPSTYYAPDVDKLGFNVITTTDPSNSAAYSSVAVDAFYTTNPFDVNVLANNQPNIIYTPNGKSQPVLFGACWRRPPTSAEYTSNPIQFPIDISTPTAPQITQNVTLSWNLSSLPSSGPTLGNITLAANGTLISGVLSAACTATLHTGFTAYGQTGNGTLGNFTISNGTAFSVPVIGQPFLAGETITLSSANTTIIDGSSNPFTDLSNASVANNSNVTAPAISSASFSPNPTTTNKSNLTIGETGGTAPIVFSATARVSPSGGNISFGTFTGNTTVATVTKAGTYNVTASAVDANGYSDSLVSDDLIVAPTLTTITVSPGTAKLANGANQTFTVATLDQFGNSMANVGITGAIALGNGTLSNRTYTSDGHRAIVTFSNGSISGSARVNFSSGNNLLLFFTP